MNKKYVNLQHKITFTSNSAGANVEVYHKLGRLPYAIIPLVNKDNYGNIKIVSQDKDKIIFNTQEAGTYEVLVY